MMTLLTKADCGKVLTVTGPADPASLGRILMHEHLHSDLWDGSTDQMVWEEKPTPPERVCFLLDDAVPLLRQCREEHLMGAFCDTTPRPWRAWPDVYEQVSRASGVCIILATGFYREMEVGTYMVHSAERAIWPLVRQSSVEQLADMCIEEIVHGMHNTSVRAGCIKLGSSQPPMTGAEQKTFRAGARAQKATGVLITTHCTTLGTETSQLTALDSEGVNLRRVVIGHTGTHLMLKPYRRTVLEWMKRGANFMPTNLAVTQPENWQPLIDAIHEVFDAVHGDKLVLGMDHGYCSEKGVFERMWFMPPPPFLYMFSDVLPVFRRLGLTSQEEKTILESNAQRLLAVQE